MSIFEGSQHLFFSDDFYCLPFLFLVSMIEVHFFRGTIAWEIEESKLVVRNLDIEVAIAWVWQKHFKEIIIQKLI